MTLQGNIGGVEVEHDAFGRLASELQEDLDEDFLHRLAVESDLLLATPGVGPHRGQLQPIQGALARQGLALVPLPSPILAERVFFAH